MSNPGSKTSTRGAKYCCVVSCHNNTKANPDLTFYTFSTRNLSQRELWVQAVHRVKPDGTLWQPTVNDRICSAHFVGGQKSTIEHHPAYIPTIFGTNHRRPKTDVDVQRFERHFRRDFASPAPGVTGDQASSNPARSTDPEPSKKQFVSISIQTDPTDPIQDEFRFETSFCSDGVGTQACIPTSMKPSGNHHLGLTSSKSTNTDVVKESFFEKLRTDVEFAAWTGISKGFFMVLLDLLGTEIRDSRYISREDRLLLCLIRIKTDLCFTAMASLFSLSRQSVSDVFHEVLAKLHAISAQLIFWPPKERVQARMPKCFKETYPNCRVILDATEVKICRPSNPVQHNLTWSDYKSSNTIKFLVGCTPSGEISFFSKAYGGRVTDTQLTNESGLYDLLDPGDLVLADKGFPNISAGLNQRGCLLVMPPFKSGNRQFSEAQNKESYKIAKVRIHVERCIARLKYFKILKFFPPSLQAVADKIIPVVCFLANNYSDLIRTVQNSDWKLNKQGFFLV